MTTSDKNLGELLAEIAGTRGVTAEKLSELTNIPKRYIAALFDNDIKSMPAAPYVRGYLVKIASVLGVDPEPLHDAYRRLNLRTSGRDDNLPKNRFALAKNRRGLILITLVVIALIGFGSIRLNALLGIPVIDINLPAKVGDRDYMETREPTIVVEGKIGTKDSISIYDVEIPTDGAGNFSEEVVLDKGINIFKITVKRFLGRETTIIRKVFYVVDEAQENIIQEQESEEQQAEQQQTEPEGESAE
jgi:hypothetical protein